ncbi:DegT/DnrJ/EryC1/StrS family aminotransferase [Nocardioides sp.]|uniref:DegT/DnrJ/EryC1/StrS family aminotransferase n=1 Tax=Nocardioides sp. TaxID=35761 RepID=UPI002D7EB7E8|nr:DegT/DnrJ/EryC1/StrS family aminotransferase [Nocardioides sp.]HET8960448.1 DegT/DnrJ/EryC1/StrS family aminotransferase [Nocardioides sp.]
MRRDVPSVVVRFGCEEQAAVTRVLSSGRVVQGEEVAAFEEEFADLVEGRPCVAVNSGTSALHLGLLAAGVGPGDDVVVPSFSFAATANAVAITGARPVFADIDPLTFCLDVEAVRAAITPRTVGVMAVHLYGQPAGVGALRALTEQLGLLLVEDACQAHGASSSGTPAGAIGDLAAFSFYATKNMTTGEGGMVVCADEALARRVRLLRNQGMEQRYRNEIVGLNNRMTDIAAAIGRVQLDRLTLWNAARDAVAKRYDQELRGVGTPAVAPGVTHAYHQYTIRTAHRELLRAHLQDHGVGAEVYYPVPIHRLPAYDAGARLDHTELAAREVLSLPIRPTLTDDDVSHVIATVNQFRESTHG